MNVKPVSFRFQRRFLGTFAVAALAAASLNAQTGRIAGQIDNSRTVTLPGHVNSAVRGSTDLGAVEAAFPLNDLVVTFKPSAAQQADLDAFLTDQQNPASSEYHNWLTPAQFADRFGPTESDIAQIGAWLEAAGFSVRHVAASRNWLAFSGTATMARQVFGVDIHRYTVTGQSHYATASEPHVPAAIAGMIAGFRGFDDFLPQAPHSRVRAAYTSGSGNHYLAPDDAATIYNIASLYQSGYDGTGQTLAVVGQSAINLSDIENFRSIFNLPKHDPQLVTVPKMSVPGVVSGDVVESDLDLEWAGAIAKNAAVVFVYSGNVYNALQYAVSQNVAPVISISYGSCETGSSAEGASLRAIAQQANSQGITLLSASGDTGAFGCENSSASTATHGLALSLPASIPEVTAVGGTGFNEGTGTYWNTPNNVNNGSAISYIPEAGWNETADGGGLGASGGGASALFAKPTWQAGPGVPADGARDVPDIAMPAGADHDGAIVCTGGGCSNGLSGSGAASGAIVVGGTSLAAPIFAGITSLVNQYQVKSGALAKAGLGNINPTLYPLAQNYGGVFHDVTAGDNIVPCRTGTSGCTTGSFGFQAGPGYDQVTGLGSVNADSLATSWSLIKSAPAALSSISASPSQVAPGGTVTLTIALTTAAPAGGLTVTLSGGISAFPLPASISVPAGDFSASLKVVAGTVTASTPITVTATYSGATKTTTVAIAPVVLPTLTLVSVTPATVTGGASAILAVALSGAAPAGGATVTLSSTSTAFPVSAHIIVPAGANTASVTVQTATVAASTPSMITAMYNGGTKTASVTIVPVVPAALTSVSVSPTSVSGGANATLTVTLGSAAPTGGITVALSSNSSAFPVPATVTVAAGRVTASVTIKTSVVTASTPATITATYNGATQAANVTITPVVLPALSSVSVLLSPVADIPAILTVNLSAAAPSGGTSVALSSNSKDFAVPASIVVPAGQLAASIFVQPSAVTASTTVTVTATYNGVTKMASATLTPVVIPTVVSVLVSQASVKGGSDVTFTVTLSAPAPATGTVITLSSTNAAVPVPPTVEMPAGGVSGTLRIQTKTVKASTGGVITASSGGTSQSAAVTVTP